MAQQTQWSGIYAGSPEEAIEIRLMIRRLHRDATVEVGVRASGTWVNRQGAVKVLNAQPAEPLADGYIVADGELLRPGTGIAHLLVDYKAVQM